jgi:multimeric flavodoxin WrbA
MAQIEVRKGTSDVKLDKAEFARRFREHFYDPAFEPLGAEIDRIVDVAWEAYQDSRKAPRTRKAGRGFADPDYDISLEWLATREAIAEAERRQKSPASPSRILLINGSPRNEHTCPGEMSKTHRLVEIARQVFSGEAKVEIDVLDLSRLTAEFARHIHPCKGCVSTAMPLCHWPCSCYPNHSLQQVDDWMADIYPMWAAAHGVMIVTPVHWYQAPTVLKSMIDRLVCADGGNPDPSSTSGKDAQKAKDIEQTGWDFPRHLAGRVFSVVVHGDSAGAESLRRGLGDWLGDMGLVSAGHFAELDRYIGYYGKYAENHVALDEDTGLQEEVRNAARTLRRSVDLMRQGHLPANPARVRDPRPK